MSILLTFVTNLSYTIFSGNLTTLLNLLKSIGTVFNFSAFRLARSDFPANLDVSTAVAFLNLILLYN